LLVSYSKLSSQYDFTDQSSIEPADVLVALANHLTMTGKFTMLPLAKQLLAGCFKRVRSDAMPLAIKPLAVVLVAVRIDVQAFAVTMIVRPVTCTRVC